MHCGDLNGKEIQKRGDICIADSFCCIVETNRTLHSNCTPIKINQNKTKKKKMFPVHLVLSVCQPWNQLSPQRALVSFKEEQYLENKIWALDEIITVGVSLLLGLLAQS